MPVNGMAKTVKIGRRQYKIRKARISPAHHADCDIVNKEIRLAHDLPYRIEPKILLHEIFHGVFAEYVQYQFTEDEEHVVITALERGLSEFAKHNQAEWIMLAIKLAGRLK
jgi:hypothetical protein